MVGSFVIRIALYGKQLSSLFGYFALKWVSLGPVCWQELNWLQRSHRVSWKRRIWPVIFYIFVSYRYTTWSTVNIPRICSHSPHPLEKALPYIIVNNIYCFLLFFLKARAASLSRGKKGWKKKTQIEKAFFVCIFLICFSLAQTCVAYKLLKLFL